MIEYEYKGYEQDKEVAVIAMGRWDNLEEYECVELIRRDQWYLIGWLKPNEPRPIVDPIEDSGGAPF